ncbi:MAG TPA: thioredoxin-dependent thiol peroxidase [Candidatus Omnitrophica bacterium]|nr:MAG: hypothetical protein A2Z92_02460 [Omnitrophica WOR_2 bacterium GWA2_63_20]OGX18245.1 MAG: hypothetical protein A2105_05225 [Omnitrophica WOR_2 bacterium GWF2_63_9]OGX32223.1 MAG: hypothetical protein A3E56_01880 [Omnitrophica WOR_2 bacterium RIFCSPHIGHO2_12_FULL_64_13]OGX35674.1 MAG: hypothetical protein A3B73_04465 [Omnitrophica WOR_2 bacterium RIFCSPHIGHO2_02_FULL_63_39]OGX44346.1 MAG: hypothetical protein A3I71_05210 [Omnitrophica WOR_2 bacterium RIFCSPLOWO2_02_FULL_63_16]OGX47650.1
MSRTLAVGQKAPEFQLSDQEGEPVKLAEFRGKKVVLYFYPKDDTPGCTKEACSFQEHLRKVAARHTVILGVSRDDTASHQRFAKKYRLTFPLLSDVDASVCKAYGVYKQKSLYGRTYLGIERTTVIIDEAGRIAKIFPKVKVEGHTQEVLQALEHASAPACRCC